MTHYTYLWVDLACMGLPFFLSFHKCFPFYKYWCRFFLSATLVAVPFLVWDVLFTMWGVWGFNPTYLVGFFVKHLPLEEILFFYCIPFACVFTYFALKNLVKKNPLQPFQKIITFVFLIVSLSFVFFSKGRLYPLITGIAAFIFLLYLLYKKIDFSYGYLTYFFIYPFFLLSNGVLTGSGLEAPIVWYNNAENFFIRMGTIPIEDSLYGFLLIAANIVVFEWAELGTKKLFYRRKKAF